MRTEFILTGQMLTDWFLCARAKLSVCLQRCDVGKEDRNTVFEHRPGKMLEAHSISGFLLFLCFYI